MGYSFVIRNVVHQNWNGCTDCLPYIQLLLSEVEQQIFESSVLCINKIFFSLCLIKIKVFFSNICDGLSFIFITMTL